MRTCVYKRFFLPFLCTFLFVISNAWAQTGTTSVRGTVMDKSGAIIAGATVKLTDKGQGVQRNTTSSSTGAYEFLSLQPGTYSLRVEAGGFRSYDQKNIELLVNNPTTINVTMEVGATTETVEVSAIGETLNTTDHPGANSSLPRMPNPVCCRLFGATMNRD